MAGQQAADLLQAGPRRRYNAHRPGAQPVSEAERHAVKHSRSRARPHQQQPVVARIGLEANFVLQRHIVAEKEDVQTAMESVPRLGGGIAPGHRDNRHVGLGMGLDRAAQRLGPRRLARARLALLVQQTLGRVQGSIGRRVVGRADGDDQVIGGRRFRRGGQQARLAQNGPISLGGHHHGGVEHAGQPGQLARGEHQGN